MSAVPVAWLHTIVWSDGEPDAALSFSPDSFPFEGEEGFRRVSCEPLFLQSVEPAKFQFPVMLRQMWSSSDVQRWIDEQGPLYRMVDDPDAPIPYEITPCGRALVGGGA